MTAEQLQAECEIRLNIVDVKTFLALMEAYERVRANEAERIHDEAWSAAQDYSYGDSY